MSFFFLSAWFCEVRGAGIKKMNSEVCPDFGLHFPEVKNEIRDVPGLTFHLFYPHPPPSILAKNPVNQKPRACPSYIFHPTSPHPENVSYI